MKEKKQISINLEPNIYTLTLASVNNREEFFEMLLISGKHGRSYSLTPKHAKRLSLLLNKQIEEYEKANGKIETKLPKRKDIKRNPLGFQSGT